MPPSVAFSPRTTANRTKATLRGAVQCSIHCTAVGGGILDDDFEARGPPTHGPTVEHAGHGVEVQDVHRTVILSQSSDGI